MTKVALVEIFRSIQGEGYHTGRPAIFVRLAGCNLACVFAEGAVCDTPYQHAAMKLSVFEVMAQVQELAGGIEARAQWHGEEGRPMFILTGGEPTMAPQFDALVDAASQDGFYVAVETNGTMWRSGLERCDWVCVSPKVDVKQGSPSPHHNPHPQDPALNPRVTAWLRALAHTPSGEYRYVIAPESPEPLYLPAFRHYVSPAVASDGTGLEWKTGFPGFVPGAVERCQRLVWADPRWQISIQTHKLLGVR